MTHHVTVRTTFDFEMGDLQESPCRRCEFRECLPHCTDGCQALATVRVLLAQGVSSVNAYSPKESFHILSNNR